MPEVCFINYKIDASHNKHVRGVVRNGAFYYRFWGRMGFRLFLQYVFMSDISPQITRRGLAAELDKCKSARYIEIDVETVEKRWPDFRYELESSFLLEKLAHA